MIEIREKEEMRYARQHVAIYFSPDLLGSGGGWAQSILTYVEYRAVSGVFQNIDPPTPSPPSECVLPLHQRQGGTHSPGGEGEGGQYFARRQTLDWPLSTGRGYSSGGG
jgi:hypothetical protein